MTNARRCAPPVAGLLLCLAAAALAVRDWAGERALGQARQTLVHGNLLAATERYRAAAGWGSAPAGEELALLLFRRGAWPEAEAALREASARTPSRGVLRLLEASILRDRPGPWDAAREERVLDAARRAVAITGEDPVLWRGYGEIALAVSRRATGAEAAGGRALEEAAQAYREALRRDPARAAQAIAGILDATGDAGLAIRIAGAVPDTAALGAAVGVLVERRRWAEDAARFWAAARAAGDLPRYATAAARALGAKGRGREALEAARTGLAAAPDDPELVFLAGDAAARLPGAEAEAAVAYLARAVTLAPHQGRYRRRYAQVLAARGDAGGAERELRSAIAAEPGDDEAHHQLGQLLRAAHREEEARASFRRALELHPENPAYRRALERGGGAG